MNIDIIADYHTHTNIAKGHIPLFNLIFKDHAKGSIKTNVEFAIKNGLKEIAITDHGYRHIAFGMKLNQYKEIRKIIDDYNESPFLRNNNFRILLGVECNIINKKGDIDITDDIIEYLDLICAGYHPGVIQSPFLHLNYTEAAINAISKHKIAVINHPLENVNVDIYELAKVASLQNTALEINRAHKNMDVKTIKELKKIGVKFSLGSDSHKSETVGEFGIAYKLAIEAGLSNDDIINANGDAHTTMNLLKRRFK